VGETLPTSSDVDLTNNDSLKPRFNTRSGKKILKNVQRKGAKRFHHRAAFWKLSKMTTNTLESKLESNENQLTAPAGLI